MAQESPYMTIEEVAQYLRVSEAKVRELIRSRELNVVKVGRQYRITREELQKYVQRHS